MIYHWASALFAHPRLALPDRHPANKYFCRLASHPRSSSTEPFFSIHPLHSSTGQKVTVLLGSDFAEMSSIATLNRISAQELARQLLAQDPAILATDAKKIVIIDVRDDGIASPLQPSPLLHRFPTAQIATRSTSPAPRPCMLS
jgi:hypothetical protein